MPSIDAQVGRGKQNDLSDVLIVRLLLNKFLILGLIQDEKGDTVWPISPFGSFDADLDRAIRAFQRDVCGFKPDGVISPGKTTIKKLNGPVSAATTPKPAGGGSSSKSGSIADSDRKKLADFAVELAKQGCHYVTGGYGATPDRSDGHPKRTSNAALVKPSFSSSDPAILAAKISGKRICKGRYKNGAVNGSHNPNKAQLGRYLDWIKDLDSAGVAPKAWMGFKTFERFEDDPKGSARIGAMGSLSSRAQAYIEWHATRKVMPDVYPRKVGSQIILGEDCSKRRHFDCIGFVNYCISEVWKSGWMFGYDQYKDKPKICNASEVKLGSGLKNGDLVLRDPKGSNPFHIGLVCNNGSSVVNAKGSSVGMGIDKFSSANWDYARRIMRY